MKDVKDQKRELTLEEKLEVLTSMHKKSHPEAKQQIEKWKDDVERLVIDKEWISHPNTIDLRKTITEQVGRIMVVLSNDSELGEADRKALFKTKEALFVLLALLTRDPAAAIKEIEGQVAAELT